MSFLKVHGTVQRLPSQIASLSDSPILSSDEGESDTSLEKCRDPLYDNSDGIRKHLPKGDGNSGPRQKRNRIEPGGSRGISGVTGEILELVSRYAVCPLTEIVYTPEYLTNPLIACKRLDSKEVKDAIDTRASIINTWSRDDFRSFYSNESTVKIWSARHIDNFDNYYLSFDETTEVIYKLLVEQCGDSLSDFVKDLVDTLECKVPKRNCFVVISPPSAGKNFFFDGIRDYYLNAGQMNNPNKYNQFAYQDCHNRKILIWNEPSYEGRETENLKMLFAGDNMSANVKCKPQANVKRTPVIVLSNSRPHFVNHYAFKDRICTYYWNSASWLKDICKKPRPDSIMELLFNIYNML